MRIWFATVLIVGLLCPGLLGAQQVKSPVVGVIKSGAARGFNSVSSPDNIIIKAADPPSTTDSNKVLVVTQVCFEYEGTAAGFPVLNLGDKQLIIRTGCTDFNPGLVVSSGGNVACTTGQTAATISCGVAGVVTTKAP